MVVPPKLVVSPAKLPPGPKAVVPAKLFGWPPVDGPVPALVLPPACPLPPISTMMGGVVERPPLPTGGG